MTDWFKAYFQMLRFAIAPRRRVFAAVFVLVLLCNITELLWPEILRIYIDSYSETSLKVWGVDCSGLAGEKGRLIYIPLVLVAAAGLRWITNYIRIITQGKVAQDVLVSIRARIFERMQAADSRYHDRVHSGSLITNLVEDVRFSTVFFENSFFNFIEAIGFIVLSWVMLYRVYPASGLTVMCCMLVTMSIAAVLFRFNLPRFIATRTATADMVRSFNEYVEGRLLIHAYGTSEHVSKSWNKQVRGVQDAAMREVTWQILMHQVIMWGALMSIFGSIAAYVLLSRENGTPISDGVLVYMISILIIHLQRVRQFLGASDNTMRFMVTAVRLREFLGDDLKLADLRRPDVPFVFDSLEFRNVSFGYDPERLVLRNVSFTIDRPLMLGIAGLTGAGKSTVVQLATGLYTPTSGEILLNGKPLGEWDPAVLRYASALVFQDVFLFAGNVSENIGFGLDAYTEDQVADAAAVAEATEFIDELPQGFKTEIGEKGVSLSGGQRQRLSLARALIRKPAILVLDSCTSALDTETETKVLDNINMRSAGMLTMVISHRASALVRADLVLIMENGQVAAFAPPTELAQSGNAAWQRATLTERRNTDTGGFDDV
jgi:ATP-binding cassette subfamily B protein